MFKGHHDPDVVDLENLSPWEREQHERELARRPARPAAQDYAADRHCDAAGQEAIGTAQATADAVLSLLLSAQSDDGHPTAVDWPTVLAGLVQRGGGGEAELSGAKHLGLISAREHDDLLEQVDAGA